MSERRFPVLADREVRGRKLDVPRSVPWSLLAPHEARALRNHSQTLERLAERGGLSPAEMWCVVHDKNLREGGMDAARLDWLRSVATC